MTEYDEETFDINNYLDEHPELVVDTSAYEEDYELL